MKAVILAAGCSRRLRPLTDHTPKCLLSVGGVPILKRALKNLIELGFGELVFVTGYLEHKIRDAVASWYPELKVRYIVNEDYERTNNAYSLLLAREAVDGESFFLLDGDIVFDRGIVEQLLVRGADSLALRTQGDIGLEEVKVSLAQDGAIAAIGKTVPVPESAGESIGIEYFSAATSSALFTALERRVVGLGEVNEYYEASFQAMFDDAGVRMTAVAIEPHYASEIDTRDDLAAANAILLARRARAASLAV